MNGTYSQKAAVSARNINLKTSRAKEVDHPQKEFLGIQDICSTPNSKVVITKCRTIESKCCPSRIRETFL